METKKHPKVTFFTRAASLLLFLVVLVLVSGMIEYPVPGGASFIANRLYAATGTTISIRQVTIRPWSFLRLTGVSCQDLALGNAAATINGATIQVRYRVIPLLKRARKAQRCIAALPDTPDKCLSFWEYVAPVVVSARATVDQAEVRFRSDLTLQFQRATIAARPGQNSATVSVSGDISADTTRLGESFVFEQPRFAFSYDNQRLEIENFRARALDGTIKADLALLTQPWSMEQGSIKVRSLQLGPWYSSLPKAKGDLDGKLDATISLGSFPLFSQEQIKAEGSFDISNLTARKTPLQKDLFLLLALPDLQDLSFDQVESSFSFANGTFSTPLVSAKGDPFSCVAGGWIALSGLMHQNVTGKLTPRYVKKLDKVVSESLVAHDDGSRSFTFTIRGDFANPRISHDPQTLKRAVNSVFKSIKGEYRRTNR